MPLYVYKCGACGGEFPVMHSMRVTVSVCTLCKVEDNLSRIPQMVSFGKTEFTESKKTGEVVKEHIEEARQDVKEEKEKLKKEFEP